MIRYTLVCDNGHDFESWFPSSASYDAQAARGLVTCPICDSARVGKAMMAPSVARTDRDRPAPVPASDASPKSEAKPDPAPAPAAPEAPVPMLAEPERQMRAMLRAFRAHVTRSAEHVGPRFADEARAMHCGDAPTRAIYGEASAEDARALIDEGIEVAPLPPAPDDRH